MKQLLVISYPGCWSNNKIFIQKECYQLKNTSYREHNQKKVYRRKVNNRIDSHRSNYPDLVLLLKTIVTRTYSTNRRNFECCAYFQIIPVNYVFNIFSKENKLRHYKLGLGTSLHKMLFYRKIL